MKKTIITVAVIAVIIVGWVLLKPGRNGNASAEAEVTAIKVERGPIRSAVSCTGRVVSNLDVDIKCKAGGEIISLPFDVSDSVSKGDLLAELDPADEQRRVNQAKVQLSSSQARLGQARQNLDTAVKNLQVERKRAEANLESARAKDAEASARAERISGLFNQGHVSREELEAAETAATVASTELENAEFRLEELKIEEEALDVMRKNVDLAEAQVESDRIELETAEQRLADTKVVSPMDGVVAERFVQVGQIISSPTSNVSGGTTLLTVSDLSRIYVIASVDESDIGSVEVGQPADITADALPDSRFRGEVVRIATRGQNVSNVVTFEVKIEVTGKEKDRLKPEMTANVEIIAGENPDALILPASAISRDGGKSLVYVPGDDEPRTIEVETGIEDGVIVEILSGLEEGQEVLVDSGRIQSRWVGGDEGDAARQERIRQRMMQRMQGGGGRR
jgi:RND family efflux transporter MFP subunit